MTALRPPRKILAIDDEPGILRMIQDSLGEQYKVTLANDGPSAIAQTIDDMPDLILVDQIMPGLSGLDVVKLLRKSQTTHHIPILMITALKESVDRIGAYQAGVDDFISKPFHPDELVARVEARLLRTQQTSRLPSSLQMIGNLSLNPVSQQVLIKDKPIRLTRIEFKILELLMNRKNRVVSRDEIIRAVWSDPKTDPRLLDIHVATLRRKIKGFNHKIETLYGKGYVIRSPLGRDETE